MQFLWAPKHLAIIYVLALCIGGARLTKSHVITPSPRPKISFLCHCSCKGSILWTFSWSSQDRHSLDTSYSVWSRNWGSLTIQGVVHSGFSVPASQLHQALLKFPAQPTYKV